MGRYAKGVRVTGDDRESLTQEVCRRYGAGESIRSIAADTGRSYGFIHRLLAEAGTERRSRGGAVRRAAS